MSTFTVTTFDDQLFDGGTLAAETADGGGLSLREAIGLANSAGYAGTDEILIAAAIAGQSVQMTHGELLLSSSMNITGDLTLDGLGQSRVMRVSDGQSTLAGLTLTDGAAGGMGGGLLIEGGAIVTLYGVTVSNNTAAGGAGGIHVASGAEFLARDTAVIGNSTGGYGGGMIVHGAAAMVNAEIGGNSAGKWGGGVDLDQGGSLTLINATVHGNAAGNGGAGVDAWNGALTIEASTFTGNSAGGRGGAIYMSQASDSQSAIANSIFAGNAAGAEINGRDLFLAGTDVNFGDNIILGTAARTTSGTFALTGANTHVLEGGGVALSDVFAQIDGTTGGGLVADNGGAVRTAALRLDAANLAIGGGAAPDLADMDGDGSVVDPLPIGANGATREGALGADIGAYQTALVVTSTLDVTDLADGVTTLREAIEFAGAIAGDAPQITFDADVFGGGATITLTEGQLSVFSAMSIDGDADGDGRADVTLDAGGLSRVLALTEGADLALNGVVVTGGSAASGGGIHMVGAAALTLTRSTITGNSSFGNGAGIEVNAGGTLHVRDAVIADNDADASGGGVVVYGDAVLVNVEISGNTAAYGGGIEVFGGTLELTNATVHGNGADNIGGGIDAYQGTVAIQSSTITGNGAGTAGGLYVGDGAAVTVGNTIIAGNASGNGADAMLLSPIANNGGLILGQAASLNAGGVDPGAPIVASSDLFAATDAAGGGVLGANGGYGATVALKVMVGNPALGGGQTDAALVAADTLDLDGDGVVAERLPQDAAGVARNWFNPDIGALEAGPVDPLSLHVTTAADVFDENDGLISLREAVAAVNSGALAGTITFDDAIADQTIMLTQGEIRITGNIAIDGDVGGDGAAAMHIDGGGVGRIFNIDYGSADLHGLVLQNGDAGSYGFGSGGAIFVGFGELNFRDGAIRNSRGDYGGGVYAVYSSVNLVNVELADNIGNLGGGVFSYSSDLTMTNSTIADNVGNVGGGLYTRLGTVDLTNLTVANNQASDTGGGLSFHQTAGSMVQSTVTGNISATGVGGVEIDQASDGLVLANSIIAANVSGGGIAADLHLRGAAVAEMDGTMLLGQAAQVEATATLTTSGTVLTLSQMPETVHDVFLHIEGDGAPALFNAGGAVRTVPLKIHPGNPALGAGDPGLLPADDQDLDGDGNTAEALPIGANGGEIRAGAPDLGAAALPPFVDVPSLVVTSKSDVVNPWDGQVTLREAIAWANDGVISGTITFAHGAGEAFEYGGTISLNGAELLLTRADIAIDGDLNGDGIPNVTLDAGGQSRVLHIAPEGPGTTVIRGLSIANGVAPDGGGVMVTGNADLRFFDTDFIWNTAAGGGGEGNGGGIFVDSTGASAYVELNGGGVFGNNANLGGGIAVLDDGHVNVLGTLIAENYATGYGGGVIAYNSFGSDIASAEAMLENATIANNFAGEAGGGFAVGSNAYIYLISSTVTGNDAAVGAAGVAIDNTILGDLEAGQPMPETVNSGTLVVGLSIIAGNGADPANEIMTHDPNNVIMGGAILAGRPLDYRTGAGFVVPDSIRNLPDIGEVAYSTMILSDQPGLELADIFDAIDPSTGGGELGYNGGRNPSVALKADFANPAIDAAPMSHFEIFGADLPPERLPYAAFDASGGPRDLPFLDPLGPGLLDIGAAEVQRQPLPDNYGDLPAGPPALADLSGGASSTTGTAAQFNGAAFLGFGADDRLVFEGATSAAQFMRDGAMLIYDADGDGDPEAQTYLGAGPGADNLRFTEIGGGVSITAAATPKAIGEVVQLTVNSTWQSVEFANTYENAVVFALAPTLNEADAAATRFKNITGTGAEIRLQEPKRVFDGTSNPGDHGDENVTLLVLEAGVHTLEDGTVIQVGELETSKLYVKGFETVDFAEDFSATPSIFSQVQTVNGTDFIISRQRNPGVDGFELTMQEEQADNLNHATETVGWFAIEHGGGSLSTMDWQAGSSAQNVNGNLTPVYFSERFDEKPLVVAALASYNGTDTSSPRIGAINKNAFTAMALEDQSFDEETLHGKEIVDWMAFSNEGLIFSDEMIQVAGSHRIAASGFVSTGNHPVTVEFGSEFDNPIVIATMTSRNGSQEAVARVSDVTSTGFNVRVQETDALDGNHGLEDISWIVVEAGTWALADGTLIQAGLEDVGATTRQGFDSITFDAAFTANPAVLSQTQTMNDTAFVKTRMQGVDGAGFAVALEEEEAASWGSHGTETVGWIAVDMGMASDIDGFVFEAGEITTNHSWRAETFEADFDAAPGVVAGMATFNASDTAGTRMKALTETGFDIRVEEDTSLNAETGHGSESFHWIAFAEEGELWGDALLVV